MRKQPMDGHRRSGFTLIEIMAVLAIIAILTSIAVVVAGKVTNSGRIQATQDIIRVLDTALDSYKASREESIPPVYVDDAGVYHPIWDGRAPTAAANTAAEPSLALFLLIAGEVPEVDTTLKGIDARFASRSTISTNGTNVRKYTNGVLGDVNALVVKDAWNRPIRFVHPTWDGGAGNYWNGSGLVGGRQDYLEFDVNGNGAISAQERIRRSYRPYDPTNPPVAAPVGDADEGLCPGNQPYFYSAGADGDPGTRSDNVYTKKPEFPTETKDFE